MGDKVGLVAYIEGDFEFSMINFNVLDEVTLKLCSIVTRWALEAFLSCVGAHVVNKSSLLTCSVATGWGLYFKCECACAF